MKSKKFSNESVWGQDCSLGAIAPCAPSWLRHCHDHHQLYHYESTSPPLVPLPPPVPGTTTTGNHHYCHYHQLYFLHLTRQLYWSYSRLGGKVTSHTCHTASLQCTLAELYCLVTEAHVCERLVKCWYVTSSGWDSNLGLLHCTSNV